MAGAISVIYKAKTTVTAPNRKQDERIAAIEERLARHDQLLAKDKNRLDAIEDGNRCSQRALLALLSHGIDGDGVEAMKKAKDELTNFLIER